MGEINRQLEAKNIILTEGRINIIDAPPLRLHNLARAKVKMVSQSAIRTRAGMSRKTAVVI